jgi:hypothetical protein
MPSQLSAAETRLYSVPEMMAEGILLADRGHGNSRPGDDPESQAFADEVRCLNPNWKPGEIPRGACGLRGKAPNP